MRLGHLVVPEREEEITHCESGGGVLKKNRNLLKNSQWPKLEQFVQPAKVALDYNPRYKANTSDLMFT